MAAVYLTDAAGNSTRYALPVTPGEILLLGSQPGCHLPLPETEGVAPQHAQLEFNGTDYVLTDLSGIGGVVVNGTAEASVLLVPGVAYFVGPYTLAYDPETAAPEPVAPEMPAETAPAAAVEPAAEPAAAPKLAKAALPDQPVRMRRSVNVAPLDIPAPKQENIFITTITPLYVTAVLAAAFVAGLTLRYWLISGSFFPSDFLK